MPLFVEFGAVILAMACLGEQFIGVDGSADTGSHLGASIANMVGDVGAAGAAGFVLSAPGRQARARAAELAAETRLDAAREANAAQQTANSQRELVLATNADGNAALRSEVAQRDVNACERVEPKLTITEFVKVDAASGS